MKGLTRSLTTLAGVVLAGAVIWFVPHYNRWSTAGYWAGMATFALAGAVLGIAQLRGREGKGKASFWVVFAPVLVVTCWVMLAAQPRGNWVRGHVRVWSGHIGIGGIVHNLGEHPAVLAFGLGMVFGLAFEPAMLPKRRRRAPAEPAPDTGWTSPPPAAEVASEDETTAETTGETAVDEPERPAGY